jgi:nucleoside-diphosphate-sugar epimerase
MSRFILQALTNQPITVYGEGKQTRSFCYITDNLTALMLLAACPRAKAQVVNVGNPREIHILALAQSVKKATDCKSEIAFHPLPQDDPKRRCPDTSKLASLVEWRANVSFEEGLKRTIDWFSQNKFATAIET